MGKILFWIVVFFAILLVVRLINVAKAKRREPVRREPGPKLPPAEPTVRCAQCGVFLPKSEATPVATGYRCNDPACPRRR